MPTPAPQPPATSGARHALIIEDDLVTGLDLQAMLQPLGFSSFAFASTTEQAEEQARLQRPDLTTVDLGLLSGDGVEAAQAVERACGRVATVFSTGDPQAVEEPGRTVLCKPVTELSPRRAVEAVERAVVG